MPESYDEDVHLTDAHVMGIGAIAVQWAGLEAALIFAIGGLMKVAENVFLPVFWHTGYNDRRDMLSVLVAMHKIHDTDRKEFDCLITRLNTAYGIRNLAVHSVWGKSDQPSAITPRVMKARGKLQISGWNLKEEHFTPQRFRSEADKITRLSNDFQEFMDRVFKISFFATSS